MAAEVSHPLLDSARPHDPALVAKAIAGGKQASSASASGVGGTSLSKLLSSASLSHLDDILQGVTLEDLQMRLASDRPAFLTYLKRLGVEKLGDRQATANAITKAENSGLLQASTGTSYMKPCTWEELEDQSTITVTLLVPADTTSNQLKMKCDANSLHVEYRGERTSACGKLFDTVKAADCMWELERSPRPEYDPLADAAEQPRAVEDKMVITLVKATPAHWHVLFSDRVAKKHVPPPPERARGSKTIELKKKSVTPGIGFVPRKFEPGKAAEREARSEHRRRERQRDLDAKEMPVLSAKEFWPSASATLLWRDGQKSMHGAPDHPEEGGPLYTWVEDAHTLRVSARTRKGLPPSALSLEARATAVECKVGGVSSPWCGHLVGKVAAAKCSLTVVPGAAAAAASERGYAVAADISDPLAASSSPADDVCDTLQLTLVKAVPNTLWRAPWPELVSQLDLRDKRTARYRPRRDELQLGGWDQRQTAETCDITIPFKGGSLSHDDLRVAVTPEALNVHIAGQEDAPMLGGELRGRIDVSKCTWRIRSAKPRKSAPSIKVEEMVISLAKASGGGYWHGDLFISTYA